MSGRYDNCYDGTSAHGGRRITKCERCGKNGILITVFAHIGPGCKKMLRALLKNAIKRLNQQPTHRCKICGRRVEEGHEIVHEGRHE